MDWYRFRHTLGLACTLSAVKRAQYLKKHGILRHVGSHCMVMPRLIPLYPRLISLGDNVWIASDVQFITHDVIHRMLNFKAGTDAFREQLGCIDIRDNVFIGARTQILYNVSIGPDAIVAAGATVNKSIGSGVFAGTPAKYICSIDEFIGKRKSLPPIDVDKRGRGGLSADTVESCWKRFREMEADKA